jgi:hypothetical protein
MYNMYVQRVTLLSGTIPVLDGTEKKRHENRGMRVDGFPLLLSMESAGRRRREKGREDECGATPAKTSLTGLVETQK